LLKIGIPPKDIVRIGAKSKCTPETQSLLLSEQQSQYRRSRDAWNIINLLQHDAGRVASELGKAFDAYKTSVSVVDILEFLEFSEVESHFYDAFSVPSTDDGWVTAGRDGRAIGPDYLINRWMRGEGPGIFREKLRSSERVWRMPGPERQTHLDRWRNSLVEAHPGTIEVLVRQFNEKQEQISAHFDEKDVHILKEKRVIGCTTTAAAKYSKFIRAAAPDVIIVEEAGEILESHVLTALAPTVKQVVLIGDHKQLRPKINNYQLSVEKGGGYDLNRSLFERLILQGAPHCTLNKQHRMVPEISRFPRELTYPDLLDGPGTSGRPPVRGVRDRVVFMNHTKMEDTDSAIRDRRDPTVKASKKNIFEAEMILRCVKYFGQQGYSSNQIVILTPYLGQLKVIRDLLQKNKHDTELSEMDKFDLIRAGLMTYAEAKADRKPLRLSTIGK
jgi:hypothetical protein